MPNQVVIAFSSAATSEERAAYLQSIGAAVSRDIPALNTVVATLPTGTLDLPDSPIVARSEPDYYVSAQQTSVNDPLYPQQWALPAIGAPSAWAQMQTGAPNIAVALIDSGICTTHPDLQGRILPGYDFVENDSAPQDDFGHGCSAAGILAANANNDLGIAGVAPNIQILPLRVLNAQGVGTYSDVAAAMIYAVDNGVQIINLSLGGTQSSSVLESAVEYAVARGALIVAAAGNYPDRLLYPAAFAAVIAVGAVDQNLQRSSFSPAAGIDLFAPGRDILTTQIDGSYGLMTGTSFAAPYVAGIAALELASGRTLTLDGGFVRFGGSNTLVVAVPSATPGAWPSHYAALLNTARSSGILRVIVSLAVNFQPEAQLAPQAVQAQQTQIVQAQQAIISALSGYAAQIVAQSDQWLIPALALQVDETALQHLMTLPGITNISEDRPLPLRLNSSAGVIDAPEAWAMGYTGTGQTVVIVDSGIERTHSSFDGRVVTEACYSWNETDNPGTPTINERQDSLCPSGQTEQFGTGAAALDRCNLFGVSCDHGTHVAGIAAGGNATYRGVAPSANIIAIQVFTAFYHAGLCAPYTPPCILSYTADQINALNYTYAILHPVYTIASVNLSIGGGRYTSVCDNDLSVPAAEMKAAIDQLRAVNIATVIASANDGFSDALGFPACISTAISVASTTDADALSSFSNTASFLSLLAPGSNIISSIPGNMFQSLSGTSMAAPQVTGAWALLRQAQPTVTVTNALNILRNSGVPVLDTRNGLTFRRIDLDNALTALLPPTPTPTPVGYRTTVLRDQDLLYWMQAQPTTPLRIILVVITPNQLSIYVESVGVRGIVPVVIQQGSNLVQITYGPPTDLNGNPAPAALVSAVNTHLPTILTGALDQALALSFGSAHDLVDMTLRGNALDIGAILP
ncbi:MAG: S8 family serine peptidase [Chloroflexi bacterium]|nr:S8 family serine peptidase [Chloroflexota bacterium]